MKFGAALSSSAVAMQENWHVLFKFNKVSQS
jgi:hypothetical protein